MHETLGIRFQMKDLPKDFLLTSRLFNRRSDEISSEENSIFSSVERHSEVNKCGGPLAEVLPHVYHVVELQFLLGAIKDGL